MLCTICRNLQIDEMLPSRESAGQHKYHDNLESLRTSARRGCAFCTLVSQSFTQNVPLETLQVVSSQTVNLCIAPGDPRWRLSRVQGNSELVVYCGQSLDRYILEDYERLPFLAIVRFSLCIERSPKEWETGQLDKENPGAKFISRRPVCKSASSEECLGIARAWLSYCLSNCTDAESPHASCCTSPSDDGLVPVSQYASFMPTRTINVGRKNSQDRPFLDIHNNLSDAEVIIKPWAALSHCWGGTSPMITTVDTLEQRKCGMDIESMPRTLRDAVLITRELGIEHLWIDSLCIIQDSKQDWLKESSHMPSIYRHSTLNIAAETSRHANDGIFTPRPATPVLARLPFKSTTHNTAGEMLICPALDNWETSLSGKSSILSTRAWVLQENLFAPRTLHFGAQQIFWACRGAIIAEGDLSPFPKRYDESASLEWDWHFSKGFLRGGGSAGLVWAAAADDAQIWYSRWYELVSNYSARRLTYQSDVFPALSGLARAFSWRLDDRYCAGLFDGDLRRGLLWSTPEFGQQERAMPYRAPTWSWASVVGPVEFEIDNARCEEVGGYRINILGTTAYASYEDVNQPHGQNYGELDVAELRVQGRWRGTDSWDSIEVPKNRGLWVFNDTQGSVKVSCKFDIGKYEDYLGSYFEPGDWGLLQIGTWEFSSELDTIRVLFALILHPLPKSNSFERIGIARIYSDDEDTSEKGIGWEFKDLILI